MAVNLAVMDVVGRQEAPVFTWNPVEQMWVQERGGAAKPPPSPHDIHAIQTWFLDTEDNEWIQTVLGPMGRQLAAQWRGAYRVPDGAINRETKTKTKAKTASEKGRFPLPILIGVAVVIALIGGVAVAAPGLMNPSATAAPSGSIAATATPKPGTSTEPSAQPTPEPTPEPTVAPTQAPTVRPRPAGPSYTLRNGTVVTYTGPATAVRNATLAASFSAALGNGRAGTGSFAVFLNDPVTVSNRRVMTGNLDGAGRIVLQVQTDVQPGTYQLLFSYGGETAQITTVAVR